MTGTVTLRVGEVDVVRVIERHTLTPPDFLPAAVGGAIDRHASWLRPWALTAEGQLRFVLSALCLEYGGRRVVVDTCVGPRALPGDYSGLADDGTFLDDLTAVGFGPDDVDVVINTHLHFDHVGWNTRPADGAWVPTFGRARYLASRPEYEAWQAETAERRETANVFNLDDALDPLLAAGLLDLVEPDHRVDDTLAFVPTPGHSPGHFSVAITSGEERALITGDCAHHPVQLVEPDWHSVADHDPALGGATRSWVRDTFTDRGVLLIGTHFPPPGAGRLVREGAAVRFQLLAC